MNQNDNPYISQGADDVLPLAASLKLRTQTNFQRCAEINTLAGNPMRDSSTTPLTVQDWARLKKQFEIIKLEFEEMQDSMNLRDFHQLRDDVQDVLFTVYGMGHIAGFPVDLDFDAVCRSQYSKFDTNLDDAAMTRQKYLDLGVETTVQLKTMQDGRQYYITFSQKDQTGTDGKAYPGGKWLKSIRFQEPRY